MIRSRVPLFLQCEKNTACHLQNLNYFTQHNVPKYILICFRSGFFDISSLTINLKISQKHRDALGIYWKRTSAKCRFSEHPTISKNKADRVASIQSCKEYWISTREMLFVGKGKCLHGTIN